jgi:NAD(P) transhydrogenase
VQRLKRIFCQCSLCHELTHYGLAPNDLKPLGVHVFGTNATELVHIGQAVIGCGDTLEYLLDAVFN